MKSSTPKASVLYIIRGYTQISKTYVKSELEAVYDEYDITIASRHTVNLPYENHFPYKQINSQQEALALIEDVKPDVIHTHYLNQLDFVGPLAEKSGIPFTIRAHSFDTMSLRPMGWRGELKKIIDRNNPTFKKIRNIKSSLSWANHELCLGVLAFPFVRPYLEKHGVREEKVIDCFPVVDCNLFYDRSPNGDAVMNTGAAIPKKKMSDYIELASLVPEKEFNLYAMGYRVDELQELNRNAKRPINLVSPVEPNNMPSEYKKHQWLVYTADFDIAMVGWPMAVAEAQAAGVGVCMPNIRPDVEQYVGEGGILYDSIHQLPEIISKPVPDDIREAGFAQAEKSNIHQHKRLLTDLWDKAARR